MEAVLTSTSAPSGSAEDMERSAAEAPLATVVVRRAEARACPAPPAARSHEAGPRVGAATLGVAIISSTVSSTPSPSVVDAGGLSNRLGGRHTPTARAGRSPPRSRRPGAGSAPGGLSGWRTVLCPSPRRPRRRCAGSSGPGRASLWCQVMRLGHGAAEGSSGGSGSTRSPRRRPRSGTTLTPRAPPPRWSRSRPGCRAAGRPPGRRGASPRTRGRARPVPGTRAARVSATDPGHRSRGVEAAHREHPDGEVGVPPSPPPRRSRLWVWCGTRGCRPPQPHQDPPASRRTTSRRASSGRRRGRGSPRCHGRRGPWPPRRPHRCARVDQRDHLIVPPEYEVLPRVAGGKR